MSVIDGEGLPHLIYLLVRDDYVIIVHILLIESGCSTFNYSYPYLAVIVATWILDLYLLFCTFKNNKIKGNHLNFISKSDLKQFGVHIFIDRVDLCKHFKILCSSDKYLIMFYNRNIIC